MIRVIYVLVTRRYDIRRTVIVVAMKGGKGPTTDNSSVHQRPHDMAFLCWMVVCVVALGTVVFGGQWSSLSLP